MFNKIKHLKDLRSQAKDLQNKLADESTTGEAAWGKVKITVDGNQKITSVTIDQDMLQDKAKLEDAVKEASNEAMKKIQRTIAMKMQQEGFSLPGMG